MIRILKRYWKLFAWVAGILMLGWVFLIFPFVGVWAVMQNLTFFQMFIWLLVNLFVVGLLGVRWRLLLKALGYPIPYLKIAKYRLAAFSMSYFTPGPQFGGEPLQYYFPKKYHNVPGPVSIAALGLDRLFELCFNFGFLALGLLVSSQVITTLDSRGVIFAAVFLLVLPVGYLIGIWRGIDSITRLFTLAPEKIKVSSAFQTTYKWLQESEQGMIDFFQRRNKRLITNVVIISILVWVVLVLEYWMALSFLGLRLDLEEVIVILVASRLAMLTPIPGAVGALEMSQIIAMQALSIEPHFGIGMSLLIRTRDMIFGIIGLRFALPFKNY